LEEFAMRPWRDRAAALRGRIHGRLLLVLVVVAVLASAAAIWQFSALLDDHDPNLAEIDRETPTAPMPSGDPSSATVSPSATPSPTMESSPAEVRTSAPAAVASESTAPTEAAGGPACTASLTLDNEWSESISVTVTVANSGTDRIEGWEVLLALENVEVTSTWGLEHIEGDRYGDILFNGGVDPGGSVAPSFQADVEGGFELPATVPCTPV
jgi:hypothetical protein